MPPDTADGGGRLWHAALERLRELDAVWDTPAQPETLAVCHDWLAAQTDEPRLAALARLLTPQMTRRQFWTALVPVERAVARIKITDIDILDSDLPDGAVQARMPLTVVLDSIRSAFNVGGIFRTAECFGVAELVLCGYTPLPGQPQVARAALGTERLVPWRHADGVRDAIAALRADGVTCFALETVAGAPDVAEVVWPEPCALVLGNERFGLDAETVRLCDGVVRIPLAGRKNSLNVVSAFAVAAHTIRMRLTP